MESRNWWARAQFEVAEAAPVFRRLDADCRRTADRYARLLIDCPHEPLPSPETLRGLLADATPALAEELRQARGI